MRIGSFLAVADARGDATCLTYRNRSWSYSDLGRARREWGGFLDRNGVSTDRVVGIQSGFTPDAVALLFAVWERGGIAALLPETLHDSERYIRDGHIDVCIRLADDQPTIVTHPPRVTNAPLIEQLQDRGGSAARPPSPWPDGGWSRRYLRTRRRRSGHRRRCAPRPPVLAPETGLARRHMQLEGATG